MERFEVASGAVRLGAADARVREFVQTRDRGLRNQLVEDFQWIATTCAHRYHGRGEPFDDLQQVAVIGLIRALDRYDPTLSDHFHTFAFPTVLGELKRHFRDHTWSVRVPRRYQELRLHLATASEHLTQARGTAPTTAELADHLDVSVDDILRTREISGHYRPVSLAAIVDDAPITQDPAQSSALEHVDDDLERTDDRLTAAVLLRQLPERDQHLVYLYYFQGLTQAEIADLLGLSQVHVSRLQRLALRRMSKAAQRSNIHAAQADGTAVARSA